MKTSDFDYELPEELIALYPLPDRSASRLLHIDTATGTISHGHFTDITTHLGEGDVLVLNDTRVIPARLSALTGAGATLDILLTERLGARVWKMLKKKPREGERLDFQGDMAGVVARGEDGEWTVEFTSDADGFIHTFGRMPLPPYINREPTERDRVTYQTVYARRAGAVAAHTAGLHMTLGLLAELRASGIETHTVTLHVGVGTFRPVKAVNIEDHHMHPEFREVSEATARAINTARQQRRRIVALGTTVARTLESSVGPDGLLTPTSGSTDIFIHPGTGVRVTDALITNFHAPRSTLLMLVSALAGRGLVMRAYAEAVERRYRFLSYGDAMLIS